MASSLGAAAVEIIAETDEFDDRLRASLERAASDAERMVSRELRQIRAEAEETGRRLSDVLGDGADDAASRFAAMARMVDQADAALDGLDADQLRAIASEAAEVGREFERMYREAYTASGAFEGMSDRELAGIARAAEMAHRDLRRLVSAAGAGADAIDRFTDPAQVRALAEEFRQAQRQADRLARTPLQNLRHDVTGTAAVLAATFRGAADDARDALDRIDNADFRRVLAHAITASEGIRAAFRRADERIDFSRSAGRAARGLGLIVAAGAGVAALTSSLGGLVAAVGALAAALAPTVGILAGLPATIALTGGALAALRVGLVGVGDAFGALASGDAAKFEQALAKLAPSAQAFLREAQALGPAMSALRRQVQGALFAPLQGELTAVAQNLTGPLRAGLTSTAAEFGRLGKAVFTFGRSSSAVTLVRDTFATLSAQLGGIDSSTVTGLLSAVQEFIGATLPGFSTLGSSIDGALGRLSNFLSTAARGGQALQWLESGKTALSQLGSILADVGATVGNVVGAIQAAGGGTLGSFAALTERMREFTASAEGASQITEIFRVLNTLASQTGGVIEALVGGLADLAPTLSQLALLVGPILTQAIQGVVPALQGLGSGLVGVFEQVGQAVAILAEGGGLASFGQAVGDLLAAVAPLAPAFASLVNSGLVVLGPVLSALAPVVSALASAFRALAESPAGLVLGPLVVQFGLVAAVTGKLGLALRSLLPTLRLAGVALRLAGQAVLFLGRAMIGALVANPIVAAIAAVIAILVLAYQKITPFREAVNAIGSALASAGRAALEFGRGLVEAFQAGGISGLLAKIGEGLSGLGGLVTGALSSLGSVIWSALSGAVDSGLSALAALPGKAVSALASFGPQVGMALLTGLAGVLGSLAGWAVQVVMFFVTLPIRIGAALLEFGPSVLRAIASGTGAVLMFIANFVIQVVAFFITLPFRILGALLSLALALKQPFINAWNGLTAWLSSAIPAIGTFFSQLPGRVRAWLAGLPAALSSAASSAWNSFRNATVSGANAALQFVISLPGRIRSGLASLASHLSSAASAAWNAFKDATVSGLQAAISFAQSLPGRFLSALSSFGSQMSSVGRDIMQGLINGLKSLAGSAIAAVTAPISDAVGKAKSLLGISSPSKVFKEIGRDVGRGFIKGVTGEAADIDRTFEKLISDIKKAFEGKDTLKDNALIKQLKSYNKELKKLADERDAISEVIKAANEKVTEVADAVREFASLGSIADALGEDQQLSPRSLILGLQDRLRAVQTYRKNLNSLIKRGLSDAAIAQIEGEGIEAGSALAASLVTASSSEIKKLNSLTGQVSTLGKGLGRDVADALFDSGKQAGRGFLAGLKADRDAIIKEMTTLAKEVAKTVKKTLKISSPSRVFDGLGRDTLAGYLQGVRHLAPRVEAALADAVDGRGLKVPDLAFSASSQQQMADRFAELAVGPAAGARTAAAPSSSSSIPASGPRTVVQNTVNAPVTVMPNADPVATGRAVSEALAARLKR